MPSARLLCLGGGLLLALLVPSHGAAQDGKCLAAKYKAVGQYLKKETVCRAKAARKGLAVDPLCQQKAEAKLARAFQKAEARGDCVATGDLVPMQAVLDADLETYTNALEVKHFCCELGGGLCAAMLDDAACVAAGGALGLAGTRCDGATGGCLAEPVTAGCCRDLLEGASRFPCIGGPAATPLACADAGGTFTADAVCENSGLCVPSP